MKQKMNPTKRMLLMLLSMIVIFFLPSAIASIMYNGRTADFGTSGLYQEKEVKELSAELIDLFTARSYQEILDHYIDEEVAGKTSADDIEKAADDVNENWGEYQKISSVTLSEMKKSGGYYAVAKNRVVYENVTVVFTFIFDEDMTVIGLSMQDGSDVTG